MQGLPTLEDRKIMTIVMISYFQERITNIKSLSYALPVTFTDQPHPKRRVKKIKLRYPGQSGVLISSRYGNQVRGIVRAITAKGDWEHSIVVDMSEAVKVVSFKVSPTNLHMCGCKSIEMGIQASKIMIDTINTTQNNIALLQQNKDLSQKVFREVLSECIIYDGKNTIFVCDAMILPTDDSEYAQIKRAFHFFMGDILYREQAILKYRWLMEVSSFLSGPLSYSHFKMGMMKYRFNLNFPCDLYLVYKYFPMIDRRFLANYYKGVRNKTVLEFPCLKNPQSKHTLSVERSGQVTHSCSQLDEIDEVFNLFMDIIRRIKDHVIDSA